MSENLQKLQKIQLEMLKKVINIATKNGIPYILMGGTLLGAVRHHGFIPWDDDVDVGFYRKDYEIIVKLLAQELDSNHFKVLTDQNKKYGLAFCKLIDRKVKVEYVNSGAKINNAFIDIFPYDNISNNSLVAQLHHALFKFVDSAILNRINSDIQHTFLKALLIKTQKFILSFFSLESLKKIRNYLMNIENKKDSSKVANLSSQYAFGKETIDKSDIEEFQYTDFENEKIKIPREYAHILATMYGNYMQLPPKNEQINKHLKQIITEE
ncbi:LicD family protein [Paucilactobacillus sp. N302-9]